MQMIGNNELGTVKFDNLNDVTIRITKIRFFLRLTSKLLGINEKNFNYIEKSNADI